MFIREKGKWIIWTGFIVLLLLTGYYLFLINQVNQEYDFEYNVKEKIALRKFPYPFKAALAICSDIDNTETVQEFMQIQEFFDTQKQTRWGRGIGLEIGNSFYMYDRINRNEFSYYSNNPLDKTIIQKFIRSGFIDCLHSFGEGYQQRIDGVKAIRDLEKTDCHLSVWINHDRASCNLGRWFSGNLGDNPNSAQYHADVTIPYGIRFVWLGSTTCIVGQDVSISFQIFFDIYDSRHPVKTLRNMLKAFGKHLLSVFGLSQTKYSMHRDNRLVKIKTLDNGQKIYEFMRYDVHPDGIGKGADSKGIAINLSPKMLGQLIQKQGYGILYTHFGKNKNSGSYIDTSSVKAFRYLEKCNSNGDVYVTTTSTLLNYYINRRYLDWLFDQKDGETLIQIRGIKDPLTGVQYPLQDELQGLTFYVPTKEKARIFICGNELKDLKRNPKDDTGRESVMIPLATLKYPMD